MFHLRQYWLWQHVKIDRSCWTIVTLAVTQSSSSHPVILQKLRAERVQRGSAFGTQGYLYNISPMRHGFGLFRLRFTVGGKAFASRIVASPGSCNSATCHVMSACGNYKYRKPCKQINENGSSIGHLTMSD